jgi:distribution and morphology protein 10
VILDTLLYGRLFLPHSSLEALYLRRLSPTRQLRIACVSDTSSVRNGATMLALLQQDNGKYSTEYLYSTDSALLGVRGLYNFGVDPRQVALPTIDHDSTRLPQGESQYHQLRSSPYGRFSAGMELYYGVLNKSGGMSTGLRFTTLPRHTGFPYTMTLTLNPLMGNVSSTYAVKAGKNVALCSQFDFNFYSYESDLRLGIEFWRRRRKGMEDIMNEEQTTDLAWVERMIRPEWRTNRAAVSSSSNKGVITPDEDVLGVVKARWDQNWRIGILWEGRIKELLFSLGVSCDLKRREQIFTAVGAELQYSS